MANGAQNALVGDDGYGLDLPETQVSEEALNAEKEMAQYANSKDFAAIKEHLEGRIAYYQRYLPGNVPAENIPEDERGKYWAAACIVIDEFNAILASYAQASEVIAEDQHLEPRPQ